MALDGMFLNCITREILSSAKGGRIDKISQPSREELILSIRSRDGGAKLLISAAPGNARIHLTNTPPENPKAPPMFCMLMRKHLTSAKLVDIRQIGMDRTLALDFEATTDLGDKTDLRLMVELMGRHSNIILVNANGKVIDSIKRIDLETSRIRQVLPGITYQLPVAQNKLDLSKVLSEEAAAAIKKCGQTALTKGIMETLEGVSPLICREAALFATRLEDISCLELDDEKMQRLTFFLTKLAAILKGEKPSPTMLMDSSSRPLDFSFIPIHQYGNLRITKEYPSCSGLLDVFYTDRDRLEKIKQRSGDLLKLLANTSERIARKLANQREELVECKGRDLIKIKGDLVSANLYSIKKGDVSALVDNFYSDDNAKMEILLDPQLTPPQNAQRYYALYRKADTAEKMLIELIAKGEEELIYIDSVFDSLTRASLEAELDAIRNELALGGYVRRASNQKGKKEQKLPPYLYTSTDGMKILVGRNNRQNDQLTLKEAAGNDIWLHTQKIPGSHVIVVTQGLAPTDKTIEEAARIAAYHSRAREGGKIAVDYAQVRNVKKPMGAKPGMVIYDKFQTIIVAGDEELLKKLS